MRIHAVDKIFKVRQQCTHRMAKKGRAKKVAIVVIVVAVVAVLVLGYVGYLPFLNSPHFGFPTGSQMSSAAGNGKTYKQDSSPHSPSSNSTKYDGYSVEASQYLNYSSNSSNSHFEVFELEFSNNSGASSLYGKFYSQINVLGAFKSSTTSSSNITYRGFVFSYFSTSLSGVSIEDSIGYNGHYLFLIMYESGFAGSASMSACSHAVIDSMYSI